MVSLFIFVFSIAEPVQSASLDCSDIDAIVREGVAYHLTGAPTSVLPNNCAKKMKWKYFNPNIETRPLGDDPKHKFDYLFFDPKRDTYKITAIRRSGSTAFADTEFVINGKVYQITYTYESNAILQKYRRVCGIINHKEKPWIFRSDCRK